MATRIFRYCACGDLTMRAAIQCAACSEASGRRVGHGRVPVTCWCEGTTVWVERKFVDQGRTRSCGLPECGPQLLEAPAA